MLMFPRTLKNHSRLGNNDPLFLSLSLSLSLSLTLTLSRILSHSLVFQLSDNEVFFSRHDLIWRNVKAAIGASIIIVVVIVVVVIVIVIVVVVIVIVVVVIVVINSFRLSNLQS